MMYLLCGAYRRSTLFNGSVLTPQSPIVHQMYNCKYIDIQIYSSYLFTITASTFGLANGYNQTKKNLYQYQELRTVD